MTEQEKALDRIRKLLAKAESTTPEEAEALTEKAEELMLRYAIDAAQVKGAETIDELGLHSVRCTGTYGKERVGLVHGIGRVFNCTGFTSADGKTYNLVGHETDVQSVLMLYTSLDAQCVTALRVWWSTHPNKYTFTAFEKFVARRTFMRGYAKRACERLKEMRTVIVEERAATDGDLLPALNNRLEKAKEFMHSKFDLRTTHSGSIRIDPLAGMAGATAANAARLGHTEVGGTRGALNR